MSNHPDADHDHVLSSLMRLQQPGTPPRVPLAYHCARVAEAAVAAHPRCTPDDVEHAFMVQGCDGLPAIWFTFSPDCFITEMRRRGVGVLGWVGRLAWDIPAPADASALLDEGGPPP